MLDTGHPSPLFPHLLLLLFLVFALLLSETFVTYRIIFVDETIHFHFSLSKV